MPSRESLESQRIADEVLAKRVNKDRRVERIALGIGGFGSLFVALGVTVAIGFLGGLGNYRFWMKALPLYLFGFTLLAKVFKKPPPIPKSEPVSYLPPPAPPPLERPREISRWTD